VDDIYEERTYIPLDGISSRFNWNEEADSLSVQKKKHQEGTRLEEGEMDKASLRMPLGWWVSRKELPWLVLSGSPGSGKTVFLTRLAATLANHLLGFPTSSLEPHVKPGRLKNGGQLTPVPIHLEANILAKSPLKGFGDLVDAVLRELACVRDTVAAPAREIVVNALKEGRFLLLIDALDEVPDVDTRNQLLRWFKGLYGFLEKTRVVLTTRSARYSGEMAFGPQFEPVELTELNTEQMKQICQNFCTIKKQDDLFLQKLEKALKVVAEQGGSEEANLVGNPLLLNTACSVFYKLGHLPNDRATLCYHVVEHLCHSKVSRLEGLVPKGREDWQLNPEEKRGLLERIAHRMQAEVAQQWPLAEVYEAVAESLPESQRAERPRLEQYVEWLVIHTGLLYIQGSDRGECVRFHHRLFREYLAACHLKNQNKTMVQLIRLMHDKGWLTDPVWLDVVRLLPGAMNHVDKAKVMAEEMMALAQHDAVQRGRLLATLAAAVVENKGVFRLFDSQHLVKEALAAYEAEAKYWDTETNRFLLEQVGWLGDPRPDMWHKDYWQAYPPSTFIMGGAEGPWAKLEREEKIHEPYWLARYPVTNSQYGEFLKDGGYSNKVWWSVEGWKGVKESKYEKPRFWNDSKWNNPSQPVVGVSWYEAEAFCRWLTEQIKARPLREGESALQVDLPSEVEWEFAARGKNGRPYPWEENVGVNFSLANYHNKIGRTTPVGTYPKGRTQDGLYDMAGNIWEWSSEKFGDDSAERVLRGGSWYRGPVFLRASCRDWNHVWDRNGSIGFRCVLRRSPERGHASHQR